MEHGFNTGPRRLPLKAAITLADGGDGIPAGASSLAEDSLARSDPRSVFHHTAADALLSPGRFALLLAALIFAAFPEVMFGSRTFLYRDFGLFGYPLAQYHRECFWRGELALWNPLSACGIPFLAQWNTLTLYPPALLYLLGPMPWSLNFFCLAHLFLAGLGMYFLGTRWGGSRLAGAVAGIAFVFGGVMLTSLMWPAYMAALGWMPWVVLTALRAWREGGRQLALAALAGAMQMLTGAPELIALTWFFLACLWLSELAVEKTHRWQKLWRFPVLAILVASIAAAQLLPFLDLLAHSHRDTSFGQDRWPMPAWGWANLFVPLFRSYPSAYGVILQGEQSMFTSYYPGIVTVALSLLAVLRVRDRSFWIAAGVTLLCLVLAWGDNSWLYTWLRERVPQIGFMRFPVKYVILPAFLFPLMAALAVGALHRQSGSELKGSLRSAAMLWVGLLALLAVIVCISLGYPIEGESWRKVLPNAAARAGFLTLALIGLCAIPFAHRKFWSALLQAGVLLAIAADGWTHLPVIQPTAAPGILAPGYLQLKPKPESGLGRAYVAMSAHRELYRFLPDFEVTFIGYRCGGVDNTPLLDDVPTIDGFYALYLREQRALWAELFFNPGSKDEGLLDFLSVAHLSTNKLEWSSRPTALPVITAGPAPMFLDESRTRAMLRSAEFDPKRTVVLPISSRGSVTATNCSDARVLNLRFHPQRIDFEVESPTPALVTLSQAYYHPWKAVVNRKKVPLLRANYAFQALEVPAGHSRVRLVYQDDAFRLGAWISLGAILACAVLGWRRRHTSAVAAGLEPRLS